MPRQEAPGVTITYAVVAELTDREPNSLYQAATRQSRRRLPLHIHDLESVVLWLARYGTDDLRRKMVALAAPVLYPERELPPRRNKNRKHLPKMPKRAKG